MNEFLKMDIFFFITTFVVIMLGAFALVALYYVIKILKSVDHVAENVSAESDNLREDVVILRSKIRDEGMKIKHFMDFFGGMASRSRTKKKTTKEGN